jgi:hypothetical protein
LRGENKMVVTKRWFLLFITLFAFIACKEDTEKYSEDMSPDETMSGDMSDDEQYDHTDMSNAEKDFDDTEECAGEKDPEDRALCSCIGKRTEFQSSPACIKRCYCATILEMGEEINEMDL